MQYKNFFFMQTDQNTSAHIILDKNLEISGF